MIFGRSVRVQLVKVLPKTLDNILYSFRFLISWLFYIAFAGAQESLVEQLVAKKAERARKPYP